MKGKIELYKQLSNFNEPSWLKFYYSSLEKKGFWLEVISSDDDFSEYVSYVLDNKKSLRPESKYIKNNLLKGDSWGEILILKQKNRIVASFGPNRIEKDQKGKKRARPGYFSVLPKFRGQKIGTVLWWWGMRRLGKRGAEYVQCLVEKKNLAALAIYLNFGMKPVKKLSR
ncbi:MAG: GNAT family N-acetyltransferase [Candidatus Shapirobacteria bacterium]